jgi:hypothetical protein
VSLISRRFILLMSEINYVDNPRCPVRFAADFGFGCELSSTASLSPEDGVEGINASVPNVENEAATTSTIEPISSLRVSLLECLIQIPYIPHV